MVRVSCGLVAFLFACSTSGGAGSDAAPDVCEQLIPDATEYACDALAPDAEGCVGDPMETCCADPSIVHPLGCIAALPLGSAMDINCRRPDMCGCHPQPAECTSNTSDGGPQWVRPL